MRLSERGEGLDDTHAINHSSLNIEAIVCLETMLVPTRITPAQRLARALRAELPQGKFRAKDIDAAKRAGRA